jgi:hypothetical protein
VGGTVVAPAGPISAGGLGDLEVESVAFWANRPPSARTGTFDRSGRVPPLDHGGRG